MKNKNHTEQETKPLNELVGNFADNDRRVSHTKSVEDKTPVPFQKIIEYDEKGCGNSLGFGYTGEIEFHCGDTDGGVLLCEECKEKRERTKQLSKKVEEIIDELIEVRKQDVNDLKDTGIGLTFAEAQGRLSELYKLKQKLSEVEL